MSNRSIWPTDMTLSSSTIPGHSGPWRDGNKAFSKTAALLEPHQHIFCVIYRTLVGRGSYPAAEVYSTALACKFAVNRLWDKKTENNTQLVALYSKLIFRVCSVVIYTSKLSLTQGHIYGVPSMIWKKNSLSNIFSAFTQLTSNGVFLLKRLTIFLVYFFILVFFFKYISLLSVVRFLLTSFHWQNSKYETTCDSY